MKNHNIFISILFFSLITISSAQSQSKEIEKLNLRKKKIESQIGVLRDSLESVEQKINTLKSKEMIKKASDSSIFASTKSYSYLKDKPEVMGRIIKKFGLLNNVLILDYINGYFGVCVKDECGYMSELYIIKNEKIKAFVEAKKDEAFVLIKKRKTKLKNYYYLSKKNDLQQSAKNLYTILRKIKKDGYKMIAVERIQNKGIGRTINDRLTRASKY